MLTKKELSKQFSSASHMPWDTTQNGYIFQTKALEINAPVSSVWAYVKDPNHYYQHSDGAVWAQVDGAIEVEKPIALKLFKDEWIGALIPKSQEVICKVEDETTSIGWKRELFFGGNTERYQVLEPSADGTKTMSYIALKIPGPVGFFSKTFLQGTIEKSFKKLNEGIKEAAEQSSKIEI